MADLTSVQKLWNHSVIDVDGGHDIVEVLGLVENELDMCAIYRHFERLDWCGRRSL